MFVTAATTARVQIFDLSLCFKRSLGTTGTGKGEFAFSSDIDFDTIYVSDSKILRIQVFTANEQFMFMVGNRNSLGNPISLVLQKNLLYITE